MCSIMGYCGPKLPDAFMHGFDQTISRGPDMHRVLDLGAGTLAFHRLSIMGLHPEGMQPFTLGQDAVVCNGEIYGFEKMRNALMQKGYTFQSDSDCEVLLPLWQEYGTAMFSMLDAEFALVLFDGETKQFVAARDPFGIRPLYYGYDKDGIIVFAVPFDKKEQVRADWNIFATDVEEEYHVTEKNMEFSMESCEPESVLPLNVSTRLIQALQAVDNGVFAMCQDEEIAWLVETSNNVASIVTTDENVVIVASQRSNVMSALDNQAATVKAVFQLAGADVVQGEGYPAWKMRADSKLTALTVETYKKLFGKDPKVLGIHAGLECGFFSEKYPDLDMVSFGPTLRGVHSPDERLHIPTVEMVWNHLLAILKNVNA